MALSYIQIFEDMESIFEPYSDAQRGRLFMAMAAYAFRGEEPAFEGSERFVWSVLRAHIDRCAAAVEAKRAAGSRGGRARSARAREAQKVFSPPGEEETQAFFLENGGTAQQAQAFLLHYKSNGWMVGGRTPMADWQAAALGWIRRAGDFAPAGGGRDPLLRHSPQERALSCAAAVVDFES